MYDHRGQRRREKSRYAGDRIMSSLNGKGFAISEVCAMCMYSSWQLLNMIRILHLILICACISLPAYSQANLTKRLLRNKWIPNCIEDNCDTIRLERIIPFKSYDYQKVIEFRKGKVLHYYYFNPRPTEPYMVCGTDELELTENSTFSINSEENISIEIDANILRDRFYTFKYKKDFQVQQISRNEYQLVSLKTYYYKKE